MSSALQNTWFRSDNSLVSYLTLDGNSNDSKSTNNGTDANISYDVAYAKFGQGASFNGSSSKITLPAGWKQQKNMTVGCWVYVSGSKTTGSSTFICLDSDSSVQIDYDCANQNFTFEIKTTTFTGFNQTAGQAARGAWYFVVYTYDGSNAYGYANGVQAATTAKTGNLAYANANTQHLGSYNGASNWLNGYMDDVFLMSRALSANEIKELYNYSAGFIGLL